MMFEIKINNQCPFCNYMFTRSTFLEGSPADPKSGDVSICKNCAGFLEFNESLELVELSTERFKSLDYPNQATLITSRKYIIACNNKKDV